MHLLHWPKRAALYGVSMSLAIHLALLVSLAMFAVGGKPVVILSSVEVEFGNPGGDTIFDSNLEASLEMEGGHEAAPLEISDLNLNAALDAFSVNAGKHSTGSSTGRARETVAGTVRGQGAVPIQGPVFPRSTFRRSPSRRGASRLGLSRAIPIQANST